MMLFLFSRLYGSSGRRSSELLVDSPSLKKSVIYLFTLNYNYRLDLLLVNSFFSKAELYFTSNLQCPFSHLSVLVPVELIATNLLTLHDLCNSFKNFVSNFKSFLETVE